MSDDTPDSFRVGTAGRDVINDSSIDIPENHAEQEKQVPKEVQMVSNTHTILHPGTVMIKLCYTSITNRTVFRSDGFQQKTSGTKFCEVK